MTQLAAREVHLAAGSDHLVCVEREIVVNPKLGVAAEVENVAVAVDLGDGNTAVVQKQRVTGVVRQPQVSSTSWGTGSWTKSYGSDSEDDRFIIALAASVCVITFGCYLSLFCTIAAACLTKHRRTSYGLSIAGIVSCILQWIIVMVVIITVPIIVTTQL